MGFMGFAVDATDDHNLRGRAAVVINDLLDEALAIVAAHGFIASLHHGHESTHGRKDVPQQGDE